MTHSLPSNPGTYVPAAGATLRAPLSDFNGGIPVAALNGAGSAQNARPNQGFAALEFGGQTLRFRTGPNEVWWTYHLITAVENTYGGRVVQILGAKIDNLVVSIECGRGGWNYQRHIIAFMRRMINDQRKGRPGQFVYTTRNWRLKVFAVSVPFQDSVTNLVREITLHFKVQEDVSGAQTSMALTGELARLKDGIGYKKSGYNTGDGGVGQHSSANYITGISPGALPANALDTIGNITGVPVAGEVAGVAGDFGVPLP